MSDQRVITERRGRAFRTLLIGVSVVVLLAVVTVAVGPAAGLAVAGLVAVLCGFVALVAGREGSSAARGRRGAVAVLAVGGAGAFLGGTAFGAPTGGDVGTAAVHAVHATPTPTPTVLTARTALDGLRVKGVAPMTGYDRTKRFGRAWTDVDRNGCDTRNDVLARDLTGRVLMHCKVLAGTLEDPYTGRTIEFTRGASTSEAVQIDHVVSLADAWRTGAQALPQARRVALANDPLNLFAVDGPTNTAKGDGDAATWLPKRKAFRCGYVAHQVAVKRAYGLWVTRAEAAAMRRVLARCPGEVLPGPALATAPTPAPSASSGVVRGGAFCAPAGSTAVTRSGTPVACALSGSDVRLRWRRRA